MALNSAIILSTDKDTISACTEGSNEMGMVLVLQNDFASLLLELQENDYRIIFFDCSGNFQKCMKWVKIVKKLRPKVPLVVITKDINKLSGGQLYQEGISHLCEKPINKDYLKEILSAILPSSKSRDNINRFNGI